VRARGRRRHLSAYQGSEPPTPGMFAGIAALASIAALVLGVAIAG